MVFRPAFSFLTFVAIVVVLGEAFSAPPPSPQQSLVTSYNSLGVRLFQNLAHTDGNIVLSPYSIGTALSMALTGARGETAKTMSAALGQSLSAADETNANKGLIDALRTADGKSAAILNVANALIEVKPDVVGSDYRALLQKDFDADAFSGNLAAINQWIANKTNGKIPHMLDELPDNTGLVLANAAYFKGFWLHTFDKNATADGLFHLAATRDVQVPMMHDEDHFAVVKGADYAAIRLPYRSADDRFAMVIIIPDAIDGLSKLITELEPEQEATLQADLSEVDSSDVQLQIPRFRANYRASLAPALEKIGMRPAFDLGKADFSGVTGRPTRDLSVAIGDVIHSAIMDVNEESSEAAAATIVEMPTTAMAPQYQPPPQRFIVDRPFLFFIVDDQTRTILFQGRIVDPRS